MSGYVLSPRARADLEGIWDYSERRWGTAQAERYIRQLIDSVKFVATDPRRGRRCGDIRPGYFKYPVGSHVLFYKLALEGIDVVRILHGRMDFDRHL